MEAQEDEINLLDLWRVIIKRRYLIIALFFLSSVLALIISVRLPEIFEGEAIVALPRGSSGVLVNTVETKAVIDMVLKEIKKGNPIGNFNKELINSIADVRVDQVKGSDYQLKVIVQIKKEPEKAYEVYDKVIKYLQTNEYIAKRINIEKAAMETNLAETRNAVEKAVHTRDETLRLIATRNPVGFNPVDLDVRIAELQTKVIGFETGLSNIRNYEYVNGPYIYKNKIKPNIRLNTLIAGIAALFTSFLLVFLLEGIEKQRSKAS